VVELRTVMEQIEHTSLMLAPGGANRFVMEMADDLPRMVEMDAYRLMQVLDNLIGNACKFTHSGLITLQIFRDAVPAADAKNCRLCFVVQDSGEGMAAKDLDKIFDLFVRLDKNHLAPGMGVGLSIVRQWTRAMGGDIQVESAPGQGSRFSFVVEFPDVSHTDTSAAVGCSQECEVLHDRVCTLLVVDDVEENRRLLRHFCARWGYQVVEADGVIQAMAALHDASVCIDAVLVDQFMVDSSGWQLLRELRQTPAFAFLPIALISASDPQRPDEFPNDLQFDLILGKPLDYPVLARFLCDALGGVQCVQRESEVLRAPRVVAPRTVLATEDLQYLRQLLDLGRVVRIVGWAYDLAKRDPQLQTFSDKVIRLAQAADLPGLERLVQQVRAV
jgi:CheY-like chemotaxis protein